MKPKNTLDSIVLHSDLAQKAFSLLSQRGLKVGIAESCTGGLLSYHFTSLAGASNVLDGAMVSYANEIKASWLGVNKGDLQKFGAVSEQVVRAMCEGVLRQTQADVALATSGIAGPSGGSSQKPVGSIFIGVQPKGEAASVVYYHFSGDRLCVQSQSCAKALEMLITALDS